MSLVRNSTTSEPHEPISYFDKERDRLVEEISALTGIFKGFEELMTHANVLNRRLEEVYGIGKEFTTVAKLWGRFNELIQQQENEQAANVDLGVPGTGRATFGRS